MCKSRRYLARSRIKYQFFGGGAPPHTHGGGVELGGRMLNCWEARLYFTNSCLLKPRKYLTSFTCQTAINSLVGCLLSTMGVELGGRMLNRWKARPHFLNNCPLKSRRHIVSFPNQTSINSLVGRPTPPRRGVRGGVRRPKVKLLESSTALY